MRRIALVLATVATLGFGMAATAAQAHDYWRGDRYSTHEWREHEGREHRDWRAHTFERHALPGIIYGMFAR